MQEQARAQISLHVSEAILLVVRVERVPHQRPCHRRETRSLIRRGLRGGLDGLLTDEVERLDFVLVAHDGDLVLVADVLKAEAALHDARVQ